MTDEELLDMPEGASKVVQHFTSPASELEKLEEKPEDLAAELCALRERLKADKAREEKILAYFKRQAFRGSIPLGGYILEVTDFDGKSSPDWERISEELGYSVEKAKELLSKKGKDYTVVTVKKLGAPQ